MREGIWPARRDAAVNADGTIVMADTDELLVSRFLSGDTNAFDSLFLRYQDYVYNIVLGIVGRPDEAEDVSQEVFLQVHRSLKSFRNSSRFATWLYRIAVNRAVDVARGRRGKVFVSYDETLRNVADAEDTPERALTRASDRDVVRRVLSLVPVQHRDVLVLRYYQDLSIEEIAEVLKCSVSAAKVRLHRARIHFKDKYVALFGSYGDFDEKMS